MCQIHSPDGRVCGSGSRAQGVQFEGQVGTFLCSTYVDVVVNVCALDEGNEVSAQNVYMLTHLLRFV